MTVGLACKTTTVTGIRRILTGRYDDYVINAIVTSTVKDLIGQATALMRRERILSRKQCL